MLHSPGVLCVWFGIVLAATTLVAKLACFGATQTFFAEFNLGTLF